MNYNVTLQNFEKNDIINNNIHTRNFPSSNMQMHFDPRSVSTKYSHMPVLDHRKESNVVINHQQPYSSEQTFFPGDRKPHYCGFARNVDMESTLRNQFFALQKSDQAQYIPSSNSDMYNNPVNFMNTNQNLDIGPLFKKESFNDYNPNISNNIGNEIFHNSTRVQLKNI